MLARQFEVDHGDRRLPGGDCQPLRGGDGIRDSWLFGTAYSWPVEQTDPMICCEV
jgi:hypothetical protein